MVRKDKRKDVVDRDNRFVTDMRSSPECQFSMEPTHFSQNVINCKSNDFSKEDGTIEGRLDHADLSKHRKFDVFSIENLIGENIEGS